MPLSTVCVSTVSNRPRLWSSQTNIRIKDKDAPYLTTMNSTEEISKYKSPQDFYASPNFAKRSTLGYSYEFPEKTVKKEKKWSIGSLFRRKKKDETESDSDEDQKRGFLGRRRRKSDGKKRKPKTVGGFDHIVLPKRQSVYNGYNHHEDSGILSDPSCGFSNYMGRSLHMSPQISERSQANQSVDNSYVNLNNSVVSVTSLGSGDSLSKKKGREMVKARALARRTTLGNDSSSDEDSSLRSNSSLRIRSDESLLKHFQEPNHSRRSRAARTERYLKRHSKDGENPHNYLRLSKSDADDKRSPSCSPCPPPMKRPHNNSISSSQASNISGLSTVPPSHGIHGKFKVSNSTSNPSYKPPLSMNEYNNSIIKTNSSLELDKSLNSQKSISCDANIHKAPSFEDNNVLHVQFPIMRPTSRGYRNFSLIDSSLINNDRQSTQPPQPPPRDPKRTVGAYYLENGRPNTVYFDNNPKSKSFHTPKSSSGFLQPKTGSFHLNPSYRSSSEVHIPLEPFQVTFPTRPSSTTPEPKTNRFGAKNRNERHTVDGYNYLADKKPRSRRPIVIQSSGVKVEPRKDSPTQKALDFWKQIEESVNKSCPKESTDKLVHRQKNKSPKIFTSQTRVKNQVFLPPSVEDKSRSSPFKPVCLENDQENIDEPKPISNLIQVSKDDVKRKSSNLEEALDELEAIYNSLRLGDENLLDRAEQRENETLVKRAEEKKKQSYMNYANTKGAMSDSSFNYEPFDQVDSPKRKKLIKKSKIPDTKEDDMYNRRLAKEKSATIGDPQSALSNVSYLLSSPLHNAYDSEGELRKINRQNNEPDVTFDDLGYRSVMRAMSSPKTVEPQPPFGIPLEPVVPAANSDYLHAVPGTIYTPAFIPKKIPDIVKDDLAFRNLRKDSNKEPILPPSSGDEMKHIYAEKKLDLNYLKKRRAVRSLSANIGNILGKDDDRKHDVENEFRKKTMSDIADAMEIARKVLQEKAKNIQNNQKVFMSDTDAKSKYKNGDSFKECRLKFLDQLKGSDPKHTGGSPNLIVTHSRIKESTPIPRTTTQNNQSTNSSLDDLLNALAEEAKVTTERITKELKELEEKRAEEIATSEKNGNSHDTSHQSEDLAPCQKLLKAVVDSSSLVEYSKLPGEVAEEIEIQSPPAESANIVQSCFKESSEERRAESEDHDYETIDSEEDKIDIEKMEEEVKREEFKKCQSPFEERKAELVASFQELKNNIDDIKVPQFDARKTDSIYDNIDDSPSLVSTNANKGEDRFDAWRLSHCPSNPSNTSISSSNFNVVLKRSDSETSSCDSARLESLESLKSPKLVLETARRCSAGTGAMPRSSNMVFELRKSSNSSCSNDSTGYSSSRGSSRNVRKDDDDDIDFDTRKPWYHDPAKVAVACSYGVACAHQVASIDLITVLSLLFAVMSFIVAMFL